MAPVVTVTEPPLTYALLMAPLLTAANPAMLPCVLAILAAMTGATRPILRRLPVLEPNRPATPAAEVVELFKPVMTCPRPSNWPVNGTLLVPMDVNPSPAFQVEVTVASILAPSTKLPLSAFFKPCKSVPLVLVAAPRVLITV